MHTDVRETVKPWQDDAFFGGPRLLTYMVYLNSVKGGRTVFTAKGVSRPPVEGDAIFWFNIKSDGGFDSRAHHTGCPVVSGSKWIANKWVRWRSQTWVAPCLRGGGGGGGRHYPPFSNLRHWPLPAPTPSNEWLNNSPPVKSARQSGIAPQGGTDGQSRLFKQRGVGWGLGWVGSSARC